MVTPNGPDGAHAPKPVEVDRGPGLADALTPPLNTGASPVWTEAWGTVSILRVVTQTYVQVDKTSCCSLICSKIHTHFMLLLLLQTKI